MTQRNRQPKRKSIRLYATKYYPAASADSIRTHHYRALFLRSVEQSTPEVVTELACEILPLYRREFHRDQEEREDTSHSLFLTNYSDFHPRMAKSWFTGKKDVWWHRYPTVRNPLRAWAERYRVKEPWMLQYALDALGEWAVNYASFEKCEQPASEQEIRARAAKLAQAHREAFCGEMRERNKRIRKARISWPVFPITPSTIQRDRVDAEVFSYPRWNGFDERRYERYVRDLFAKHIAEYMVKVRTESCGLQRVESLTKPERFDMLALYLCRRKSMAQIAKLPGFWKDRTGIYKDIRKAATLVGLRLQARGRPKKKLQITRSK
jgi:hypothetical protein